MTGIATADTASGQSGQCIWRGKSRKYGPLPKPNDTARRSRDRNHPLLGMDYLHLPVDLKHPAETDFAAFCKALQESQAQQQKVLVHCAANMRVSAFMFRYRTQVLGEDRAMAEQDLHRIWKPFGAWAAFIEREIE